MQKSRYALTQKSTMLPNKINGIVRYLTPGTTPPRTSPQRALRSPLRLAMILGGDKPVAKYEI